MHEDPEQLIAKARLPAQLQKPKLRRWEAAQYLEWVHGLRVAPATLAKLASIGGGPAFHRARRTPLYPTNELDHWAEQRMGVLLTSTSEVMPCKK